MTRAGKGPRDSSTECANRPGPCKPQGTHHNLISRQRLNAGWTEASDRLLLVNRNATKWDTAHGLLGSGGYHLGTFPGNESEWLSSFFP